MPYQPQKPEEPTRKSVSEKQLAANRANAVKSTGPTTPDGRARSAQNSRKHGFTASKFVIVSAEDAQDLENLKADIIHTYQPANTMELLTCERIATSFFTMQRAAQFEAGMFTNFLNFGLDIDDTMQDVIYEKLVPNSGQGPAYAMAEGFHVQNKRFNDFSLFLRYKAQAERDYRRAVEEFERLRKLRPHLAEFPNEPISDEPERSEAHSPTPSPQSPDPVSPASREAASDPRSPAPDPQLAVSPEKSCESPHSLVRVERTLPPDSCQPSTLP
jgi:hypothetical protein